MTLRDLILKVVDDYDCVCGGKPYPWHADTPMESWCERARNAAAAMIATFAAGQRRGRAEGAACANPLIYGVRGIDIRVAIAALPPPEPTMDEEIG